MRVIAVCVGATVCCVGAISLAQEVEPGVPQRATPSASAPSFGEAWKGLRDKFKGKKPDEAPESASPRPDAAPAPASAAPTQIKNFTVGSKLPAKWNDSHCKNLIEPFDLSDSALSLAKLKAQTTVGSVMGDITGAPAGKKLDARAEIRKAARQLNWLPLSAEIMLGKKNHEEQAGNLLSETKSGKPHYARANRLLGEILAPVRDKTPYRFQIFVTKQSNGNAEAGPGGFIYVDMDLLASAELEPRARFAIAHEVSHVLQRHRTRETQMRLSDGVDSIEDLGKLMASTQASPNTVLKKGVDTKRLFVRHSEEQELQADGCAVRLLDATLPGRPEMIKSVSAFAQALPKPGPPVPREKVTTESMFTELTDGQVARHPTTQERIKNLNAVLADLRAGK